MASLASPPAPAPAQPTSPPPVKSSSGKSLLQNMIRRYLSIPPVKEWLLHRQQRPVQNAHPLNKSFSYACMYYPPDFIPRGMDRYPLPKPFLDIGDLLLCHHVYDGVAVGSLFNENETHALSFVRDSMLKNSSLSSRPRLRNFAVDLRVKQLEIVEFAWMDDDSLIIACRRLVDSGSEERRFVLSADMLFYEPIPPNYAPDPRYALLRMTLREKPVVCEFCGVRGYQSCICPNSLKRKASNTSPSDAVVPTPTRNRSEEPTGPFANAIGSWENYTNKVFSCSQAGSFFITSSYRRSPNGGFNKFPGPKHPIPYQFVCGQRSETLSLTKEYYRRHVLCARELAADARLYGGGLSRGSDIGMLMDKQNDERKQPVDDITTVNYREYIFEEEDVLSSGVSTGVATSTVPSQTTASQATLVSDEYGQLLTTFEMSPPMATIQLQSADDVSILSTRLSGDSPNSVLLDREEGLVGAPFTDIQGGRSDRSRHVMDNVYGMWGENQSLGGQQLGQQQPGQPRPLSTSSRELQGYMGVDDASGTPTCKACGNSFRKRGNLARHIQTVHLKLKPFQCDMCSTRFGYKTHLKRHQIVHQRGNEFRCPICNRDFRGQLKLNRHLQQAHRQQVGQGEGDNKVVCEVCGVSFSQKSNLSRHMQIHEGLRFFCPVCPNRVSSFRQKYDLQRHMERKHSESSAALVPSIVPSRE